MNSTKRIIELCGSKGHSRDDAWEREFLQAMSGSRFEVTKAEPVVGPDSWPYLLVKPDSDGEPIDKLVEWLSERGIGMVINAEKELPDFVFTYGMIWSQKKFQHFVFPESYDLDEEFELEAGEKIGVAEIDEDYLPGYAKKVLKDFFREQGVLFPKVLRIKKKDSQECLCFSLESLDTPPEEELIGITEAISWFLPTHYPLVVISEEGLPPFNLL